MRKSNQKDMALSRIQETSKRSSIFLTHFFRHIERTAYILLISASVIWAVFAIIVASNRVYHQTAFEKLKTGQFDQLSETEVSEFIASYSTISDLTWCYPELRQKLASMLIFAAENDVSAGNFDGSFEKLKAAKQIIQAHLICSPLDSNAWLALSAIIISESGFNSQALDAYKMSFYAAPREAWLAERRLVLALQYAPFFDADAFRIVRADIELLKISTGSRKRFILSLVNQTDLSALSESFRQMEVNGENVR